MIDHAYLFQSQQRGISDELKLAQKRVTSLKESIEAERKKLDDADGGRHTEMRRELEDKRHAMEQAKLLQREHETDLPNLEAEKARAIEAHEDSQRPILAKKREIEEAEKRLGALNRDRGQQQNAYSPNLPRLLRAIRDDSGFREKPVGPIGNHVRLLKPSWSSILEKQLGSALDAFIVTSKPDHTRLINHMQKTGW